MAAYAAMKPTKPGLEEPQEQIHKIRITLSSKNVKNLEKGFPFYASFTSVLFQCHEYVIFLRVSCEEFPLNSLGFMVLVFGLDLMRKWWKYNYN